MKHVIIVGFSALCGLLVPLDALALDVLVNQVGYETNSPKVFRVQRTADYAGDGTFAIRKVSNNADVFTGTLTRKGGLWGRYYWVGDFSSLKAGDDYYVYATVNGETGTSYNFTVGIGVLVNKTGKPAYQYFTAQRCGASVSLQYVDRTGVLVTWTHNACHTDDGYINPSGPQMDGVGGWHDAGDYGKYGHGFSANPVFDLLWLYDSNRSYYDAIDANSNGIADIVDEALWQARWLVKIVQPSGHVMDTFHQRRSGASWVKPENDTNCVTGTSDDRWIDVGDENTPQEPVTCAALIRMHRVLASKGLPTENFAQKALDIWNHRDALAISQGGHNNLGSGAHQIWAGLDLFAVSGQQNCYDRAVQRIDELSDTILSNIEFYDTMDFAEPPGYELGVLAWFVRAYPTTPQATNGRIAVQNLMNHYIAMADDPVGLLRRNEGGVTQYFPANPSLGINRLYGLVAWAAVESYKTIGDPAYLRFAADQYNWILGANYSRVCMMEAVGDRHVDKYHSRYDTFIANGIEPGVVPNGYIRDAGGLPWIYFGTGSASVQTNEGWLPNSAAYAMALAGMQIFTDNAQMVSNTIPSTMNIGQSYSVSVTVKNTGGLLWTAAGDYKLGTVGDSDPFFGTNRVNLGPSDSIGADQQKTFTFTLTAPTTPGTYTTDWQMVHEAVSWFGETLTKQVQVAAPVKAFNPNPANGAAGVSVTADLSWSAGSGATSHDIYFGTASPGTFRGNRTATTFDPGTLASLTTYYWRIDEKNGGVTTTGDVWQFTTLAVLPGQASSPNPANGATGVSTTADLSWTAGTNTTSHDVYFGTVNPPPSRGNQASTIYDPGTLIRATTYYWRVDEKSAAGTTAGTTWNFKTGGSLSDFDYDNDVDQDDFGHLQACLADEGTPYGPGCQDADLTGEGTVDQLDLDRWRACMNGANQPPACP